MWEVGLKQNVINSHFVNDTKDSFFFSLSAVTTEVQAIEGAKKLNHDVFIRCTHHFLLMTNGLYTTLSH